MGTRLHRYIALVVMGSAIASMGAGHAQSTPSVSAAARPDEPASIPAMTAVWDAPEPWRTDRFYFETSVYTRHFRDNAGHNEHQAAMVGEWNLTEQWLVGAAAFNNSYRQATQYVYAGYRLRPFERLQPLSFKLTGGLVHGYGGTYQHKIPLNSSGVAPAFVPSVGYCFNRYCSELVFFGAGATLTFGVTVP